MKVNTAKNCTVMVILLTGMVERQMQNLHCTETVLRKFLKVMLFKLV